VQRYTKGHISAAMQDGVVVTIDH